MAEERVELYGGTSLTDDYTGAFLGFTFDGVHSSTFNIVRISSGNRYDDGLQPTSTDKTATVPGMDGTYYFGTQHTQKAFTVPFAYDRLTEEQIRQMRSWLNVKKIGRLIFDERPEKYYMAKITGITTLKYLCFEQEDGTDLYKGEGSINFVCYYPYAKGVDKIDISTNEQIYQSGNQKVYFDVNGATTVLEFTQSAVEGTGSGQIGVFGLPAGQYYLIPNKNEVYTLNNTRVDATVQGSSLDEDYTMSVSAIIPPMYNVTELHFNNGDMPCDYKITASIPASSSGTIITLNNGEENVGTITLNTAFATGELVYDTKKHLVKYVVGTAETIINDIYEGTFDKLPLGTVACSAAVGGTEVSVECEFEEVYY